MISYSALYGTVLYPGMARTLFCCHILFRPAGHLRSHSLSRMCLLIIRCHGALGLPIILTSKGTNCPLFSTPLDV